MPEESEVLLQRSLDTVDGLRRRFLWTVGIVIVLAGIGAVRFLYVDDTGARPDAQIGRSFVLLSFSIAGWALVVCLHVTRMTKKILRAIDVSSRG